jgi:hypothetical protein
VTATGMVVGGCAGGDIDGDGMGVVTVARLAVT